jgi:hypothetical protein
VHLMVAALRRRMPSVDRAVDQDGQPSNNLLVSTPCRPLAGIVSRLMPMLAVASVNKNTLYPELQREFDEDPLNFPGNVRARAAAGAPNAPVQLPTCGVAAACHGLQHGSWLRLLVLYHDTGCAG